MKMPHVSDGIRELRGIVGYGLATGGLLLLLSCSRGEVTPTPYPTVTPTPRASPTATIAPTPMHTRTPTPTPSSTYAPQSVLPNGYQIIREPREEGFVNNDHFVFSVREGTCHLDVFPNNSLYGSIGYVDENCDGTLNEVWNLPNSLLFKRGETGIYNQRWDLDYPTDLQKFGLLEIKVSEPQKLCPAPENMSIKQLPCL